MKMKKIALTAVLALVAAISASLLTYAAALFRSVSFLDIIGYAVIGAGGAYVIGVVVYVCWLVAGAVLDE